ncbi:hypothetical protein ATCC90586_010986 [Pythium insidiosum]|nr:hypothetical protein ATCC90586_010986 [Pythium insidiosum]
MTTAAIEMDPLTVLRDSVQQARDWRNIQQIVLVSFSRVVDVLVAQQSRISALEAALCTLEAGQNEAFTALLRAPQAVEAMRQSLGADPQLCASVGASIAVDIAQSVRQTIEAELKAHALECERRWAEHDADDRALLKTQWQAWCDVHAATEAAKEKELRWHRACPRCSSSLTNARRV